MYPLINGYYVHVLFIEPLRQIYLTKMLWPNSEHFPFAACSILWVIFPNLIKTIIFDVQLQSQVIPVSYFDENKFLEYWCGF